MTALCFTFSLCKQHSWAREVLPFQCAQEAPEGWHTSVCTAHIAAQCLRPAAALLVLQPKLQSWYDTNECSILRGWSGKSHSLDVSAPVAGSVQPAKKGGWLPWTCVLFKLLLRLSSACVPQRKPMRNLARKLLTRTRQEPSSPLLELRSRFTRKSVSRSPANYVKIMGACILCTLPRTVAGMRKTEWWKPISAPPRRQVRSPIPLNSSLPSWTRNWTSWRRL